MFSKFFPTYAEKAARAAEDEDHLKSLEMLTGAQTAVIALNNIIEMEPGRSHEDARIRIPAIKEAIWNLNGFLVGVTGMLNGIRHMVEIAGEPDTTPEELIAPLEVNHFLKMMADLYEAQKNLDAEDK
jgi:hypothetical protein